MTELIPVNIRPHLVSFLFKELEGKEASYMFGNVNETISSALGKNQRDKTLSWFGKGICFILDKLDKDHCKK